MIDEMKNSFFDYKDVLFESKKYLLVYLIFITVTGLSTISKKKHSIPKTGNSNVRSGCDSGNNMYIILF